jgi:hypothetical protein
MARYRKGDIEGATTDFNQALKINPALADAILIEAPHGMPKAI